MTSDLFTSPDYLAPLEAHGCVGPESGWTPAHVVSAHGRAPCYLKAHSWGEFVFDFEIARNYARHGLDYYPKLVCCVPFTPVPGPRLLAADDRGRLALAQALQARTRAAGASGAHVLFAQAADVAVLESLGWLRREQLRYVWHNRGYADFDGFCDALQRKRRNNIRRERARIGGDGLAIEWRRADTLTAQEWDTVFALYAHTYAVRGQRPYLNLACLQDWATRLGAAMQCCLARARDRLVAMAYFFCDGEQLYGRHWGASADHALLHFELCYYQGIDYAIAHRLRRFDAGVQGEHKLLRGFDVECAHSMHWYLQPELHAGIAPAYAQERRALALQRQALAAHSAYRTSGAR